MEATISTSGRRKRRTDITAQAACRAPTRQAPRPSPDTSGTPAAEGRGQILPAVLIDRSRKTYLRVMAGSKYLHLIPMDASGLSVLKLTEAECESLGLRVIDYALKKAVERFLSAGERFGMTGEAAMLLARLGKARLEKARLEKAGSSTAGEGAAKLPRRQHRPRG
jgi:hypothetical protein